MWATNLQPLLLTDLCINMLSWKEARLAPLRTCVPGGVSPHRRVISVPKAIYLSGNRAASTKKGLWRVGGASLPLPLSSFPQRAGGREGRGREGPAPLSQRPPPLTVCLCVVPCSLYLLLPLHPLPLPLRAHRIHNDGSVSSTPPQGAF